MTAKVVILSDIHGNAAALDAVRKAIRREKPDAVIVAGDLVMNGPEPASAVDGVRELEAEGAIVVQGNTDVAVGDFDYSAAFPWMTDGVPDTFRAAAEWAHEEHGDERLARPGAPRRHRPNRKIGAMSGTCPSEPRRVVVTGMGMLTALGNDVASSWRGLVAGQSGVRTIEAFDPSRLAARIAGEVRDLDASHILD